VIYQRRPLPLTCLHHAERATGAFAMTPALVTRDGPRHDEHLGDSVNTKPRSRARNARPNIVMTSDAVVFIANVAQQRMRQLSAAGASSGSAMAALGGDQ
jgi:hypothetical protein